MEAFPAELTPSQDFQTSVETSLARSAEQDGFISQRKRFDREQGSYRVAWNFNGEELAIFKIFFEDQINNGTNWFLMEIAPGGEGLTPLVVRFVDAKFSESQTDVLNWKISAQLELKDVATWSEEVYDALILLGDLNELEAANALHILVHETLPSLF